MSLVLKPVKWIAVPAGTFWMGGGPRANENPRHKVHVNAFDLAEAPVTRREYQVFLDQNSHPPPRFWHEDQFQHPLQPAVGVSWYDAQTYCQWLGEQTAQQIRLPTEAEWEYAAKAQRGDVLYPWGNDSPESLPDYSRRWENGPEPVDAYPSTHPWGFLGLGENVHEWCSDWYDANYYEYSCKQDPKGATEGKRRSSRGGAWRHKIKVSRCAARSSIPPQMQYNDYGFRIAATR